MGYTYFAIIVIIAFSVLVGIQAYRLIKISKEWGHGEVVVRWIAPDEIKSIVYILIALIALIVAIAIQSEALLSALTALLIGFGGMLSQLTFLNVIGKTGVYLGRTRRGLLWESIHNIRLQKENNHYTLDITATEEKAVQKEGVFNKIKKELNELEELDEYLLDEKSRARKKEEEGTGYFSYRIGFREKHKFKIEQAIMYYFPKGMEYETGSH